jgi:HEAT repeat protein
VPRSLLDLLAGPDRRRIGGSPLVVRRVLQDPRLLPALVRGLSVSDPLIRMRAADALEKLAHHRPDLLRRYRSRFLQVAQTSDHAEVQWHMAQLLPGLRLTKVQRDRARRVFRRYLRARSSIVQAMALDALVRLASDTRAGQARTGRLLDAAMRSPRPAVRARARRLRATRARLPV